MQESEPRDCIVDYEKPCAPILQRVAVLGDTPADVERHDHGSGPTHSEIEFQIAARVQHQDRNPVALGDAELPKRSGQPAYPLTDLRPGQSSLLLKNGDALRIDLKGPP